MLVNTNIFGMHSRTHMHTRHIDEALGDTRDCDFTYINSIGRYSSVCLRCRCPPWGLGTSAGNGHRRIYANWMPASVFVLHKCVVRARDSKSMSMCGMQKYCEKPVEDGRAERCNESRKTQTEGETQRERGERREHVRCATKRQRSTRRSVTTNRRCVTSSRADCLRFIVERQRYIYIYDSAGSHSHKNAVRYDNDDRLRPHMPDVYGRIAGTVVAVRAACRTIRQRERSAADDRRTAAAFHNDRSKCL